MIQVHTPQSDRRFSYSEYGAAGGHPVLAFHGTPGSRLKYAVAHDVACTLGLRILSIDRWGYGQTPSPTPADISLRNFGRDMADLLDTKGLERASIVGISGGGPYAMATAAVLRQRAVALALVAPVAPLKPSSASNAAVGRTSSHASVGPAARHMSAFHRVAFFGAPKVPGLIRGTFSVLRSTLNVNGRLAMRMVTARACSTDRAIACRPQTADRLAEVFREGLAASCDGPVIDMQVFSTPWNVSLEDISARARLWIGDLDRNVPVQPAIAIADQIPHLMVTRLPDAGHFWISENYATVLGWIADEQD